MNNVFSRPRARKLAIKAIDSWASVLNDHWFNSDAKAIIEKINIPYSHVSDFVTNRKELRLMLVTRKTSRAKVIYKDIHSNGALSYRIALARLEESGLYKSITVTTVNSGLVGYEDNGVHIRYICKLRGKRDHATSIKYDINPSFKLTAGDLTPYEELSVEEMVSRYTSRNVFMTKTESSVDVCTDLFSMGGQAVGRATVANLQETVNLGNPSSKSVFIKDSKDITSEYTFPKENECSGLFLPYAI